jgi:hypothetical protein
MSMHGVLSGVEAEMRYCAFFNKKREAKMYSAFSFGKVGENVSLVARRINGAFLYYHTALQ